MLAPDDRSILREQLRPDPGAELVYAVATTFTMDLTAALVAPLAFAAQHLAKSGDPVAILQAIRATSQQLDIFCQAGHMRVPPVPSDLMAFLEPMVHEVSPPRALFHPKVWVAHYRGESGDALRLLCCTRNLTDDVSWDALVRLDGRPTARRHASNRPLVDLLTELPSLLVEPLAHDRAARLHDLAELVARAEWDPPKGLDLAAFHVLGLRASRGPSSLVTALDGRRRLVISPFLDDHAIGLLGDGETIVISRNEQLDQLTPETLERVQCHLFDSMAGLSDPDTDDTPIDTQMGGLHAKVYVVEQGRQTRLVIGSANCTEAGFTHRNVEFAVELHGRRSEIGIDAVLSTNNGCGSLLVPYRPVGGVPPAAAQEEGRRLENLLRSIASKRFDVFAERAGDHWQARIATAHPVEPPNATMTVGLLTRPASRLLHGSGPVSAVVGQLETADITPFVVVHLTSSVAGLGEVERRCVVRAALHGDPADRLDEVIARQVDTPEKFLRFLALLLGFDAPSHALGVNGDGDGQSWLRPQGVGLFERLVRTLAERPEALVDLDGLVSRLEQTEQGRRMLPPGFTDLWATLRATGVLTGAGQ